MRLSFFQENPDIIERYELVSERISSISLESDLPGNIQSYFNQVVDFLGKVLPILDATLSGEISTFSCEKLKSLSNEAYSIFSENTYSNSFLCPAYSTQELGDSLGGIFSAIFYQLTSLIKYAFAGRIDFVTIYLELFSEIYGICLCESDLELVKKSVCQSYFDFRHDYCNVFLSERILGMINPEYDYYLDILMNADLSQDDYMYKTGLYVSDNELKMAEHLRNMSADKLQAMARTYVEGYVKGFEVTGKDISIKDTVGLSIPLGFELMTREAVKLFNEAGLSCSLRIDANQKRDWFSTSPNKQCEFDHKDDMAYVWNKALADRMIEVTQNTYDKHSDVACTYGGPAVIETFGEMLFEPKMNKANAVYTTKQNELNVYYMSAVSQITNKYIHGDERSFTIISYPIPEIGKDFVDIFDETVSINTMDYETHKAIQYAIIDVLDSGESVHITGRGNNHTDITVKLHDLANRSSQTNFENCLADVNIPVGEVFTSPVLEGTTGVLHVSKVYIEGFSYKNLEIHFKDGMVIDYSCDNFEDSKEGKKLIFDNILFKHDTLPMGEFAIGTNTKAYMMGQRYDIADKLPILIAEKTGPHFAVGDTCYSHCEDVPMYNSDGKECIARDNSCSLLRKTDVSKAYFNCHTDITIPYYELGDIVVNCKDNMTRDVIKNGRFVVPGTESLNEEFED